MEGNSLLDYTVGFARTAPKVRVLPMTPFVTVSERIIFILLDETVILNITILKSRVLPTTPFVGALEGFALLNYR